MPTAKRHTHTPAMYLANHNIYLCPYLYYFLDIHLDTIRKFYLIVRVMYMYSKLIHTRNMKHVWKDKIKKKNFPKTISIKIDMELCVCVIWSLIAGTWNYKDLFLQLLNVLNVSMVKDIVQPKFKAIYHKSITRHGIFFIWFLVFFI